MTKVSSKEAKETFKLRKEVEFQNIPMYVNEKDSEMIFELANSSSNKAQSP
jgi:hypothetical protein